MSFFGVFAWSISVFASSRSPFSGSHGESGLIVSNPGMPSGVQPVAGSWSACAMLSMISRRLIASDIALRWFRSVMFLTLNP